MISTSSLTNLLFLLSVADTLDKVVANQKHLGIKRCVIVGEFIQTYAQVQKIN